MLVLYSARLIAGYPSRPCACKALRVPTPKVLNVDDFLAKLDETQRGVIAVLRALSLAEATKAGLIETLKWNWPAYTPSTGKGTVWMLQCFKKHYSIRFPVHFFANHRAEVEAAGYTAIDGALKVAWEQKVPTALVTKLVRARIRDFETGNTAWSAPESSIAKGSKPGAD